MQRDEGEIIYEEENTITRKMTECIQENRSPGVIALRQQPNDCLYCSTKGTT
jgi:hypothetical protein